MSRTVWLCPARVFVKSQELYRRERLLSFLDRIQSVAFRSSNRETSLCKSHRSSNSGVVELACGQRSAKIVRKQISHVIRKETWELRLTACSMLSIYLADTDSAALPVEHIHHCVPYPPPFKSSILSFNLSTPSSPAFVLLPITLLTAIRPLYFQFAQTNSPVPAFRPSVASRSPKLS